MAEIKAAARPETLTAHRSLPSDLRKHLPLQPGDSISAHSRRPADGERTRARLIAAALDRIQHGVLVDVARAAGLAQTLGPAAAEIDAELVEYGGRPEVGGHDLADGSLTCNEHLFLLEKPALNRETNPRYPLANPH
jgi:hypothetical protein